MTQETSRWPLPARLHSREVQQGTNRQPSKVLRYTGKIQWLEKASGWPRVIQGVGVEPDLLILRSKLKQLCLFNLKHASTPASLQPQSTGCPLFLAWRKLNTAPNASRLCPRLKLAACMSLCERNRTCEPTGERKSQKWGNSKENTCDTDWGELAEVIATGPMVTIHEIQIRIYNKELLFQ